MMRDFDHDTRLRLTDYVLGDCSPAEAAELEAWLAADPRRHKELETLRWIWETSAALPTADRIDERWRDLVAQMRGSGQQPPTLHRATRGQRSGWRWGLGVAAAASLTLAVAYAIHEWSPPVRTPGQEAPKEYRTNVGQRGAIQLGDGTRIDLGVASVIRVHSFTRERRDIELIGEAVFDVVHDTAPFTVRSRNAVIEDLGTRFGVRAYEGDEQVRVVVAEGRVAVRTDAVSADTTAVLAPGDFATVDSAGRTQVQRSVNAESYFGWLDGQLFFQNATLAEVAADLERWYEVDITFATPSLGSRRLTLSLPVSSLTAALDAVAAPLGLAHAQEGAVVTLRLR